MSLKASLITLSKQPNVVRVAKAARFAVQSGPVRELAVMCGRAGVAGAIVDGGMGTFHAAKAVHAGKATMADAAKHVGAEAGCGFVTSTAGTAGTLAMYLVTGAMGPAAIVAGMGASVGSRWAYRKVVGETLVDANPADGYKKDDATDDDNTFEDIGPE